MDYEAKKSKIFENALFTVLGALTASVISLGMFGEVDNRGPASLSKSVSVSAEFDPRIYIID